MEEDYSQKYGSVAAKTKWKPLLKKGFRSASHKLVNKSNAIILQPTHYLTISGVLFKVLFKLVICAFLLLTLVIGLMAYRYATGNEYFLHLVLNLPVIPSLIVLVVIASYLAIRSMPRSITFDSRKNIFFKGILKNKDNHSEFVPRFKSVIYFNQIHALQIICVDSLGKFSPKYWWDKFHRGILWIIQKLFYAKSPDRYKPFKQRYVEISQLFYDFLSSFSDHRRSGAKKAVMKNIAPKYIENEKTDFYRYELNLVLENGSRVNVLSHGNKQKIREDAQAISQYIGKPLWDEANGKVLY